MIGNTPLLLINPQIHGIPETEIYAKLELFNPWGSVKDRTALGMMKKHLPKLTQGKIIESSSGNTAKALQSLAGMHGTYLKTITNRIKVPEQKDILTLLGAQIEELPGKSDCYDPNDPNDPMILINKEMQKDPSYIFTDQYNNPDNEAIHYETTGTEISNDLGRVDFLFAGLGTNGSVKGIANKLRENNPNLKVIGIVATKDDYIPGIRNRDEVMEVGLFQPDFFDEIIDITSKDAVDESLVLIRQQGLMAGPTTGASYKGALEYLSKLPEQDRRGKKSVFIACDRAEWYISYYKARRPDIFGEEKKQSWITEVTPSEERSLAVEAVSEMVKDPMTLVVDTRNPLAYKLSHLPGAINMPFESLEHVMNITSPFGKGKKLLFVCAVGEKSAVIAEYLSTKGTIAFSLKNGMTAWRDAGFPVENNLR